MRRERPPLLLLLADQGDDFLEARAVRGTRRGGKSRLHHRRLHDAAFQDFAVRVHLPELSFRVGFVAAVDHEVLDHQALPGTDAKPEFRRAKWITPVEFEIAWLPEMKREVYRRVLKDFFDLRL